MNLKILLILLIYYSIIIGFFSFDNPIFNESTGYNITIDLNDSDISDDEIDTGGLFSTGIDLGRFIKFVGFGIGLPDDTPSGFKFVFALWQTMITVFTVGFVISSIWDG